nr:transposase, MuDR [Tanacetum cinerariifolium]
VDADGFSVIEVSGMLKELGYKNPNIKILYKKPTSNLDKGLEPLSKYIDVLELLSYVNKFKLIELFIEHPVDKCVIDKSVIDLVQEDNSVIDGLESSNACLETNECEALENDNAGLGTNEDYLERLVTHEEIKEAVWDCGSSKAPGPDGFSFAFVKKYWDIIRKDLHDFIHSFF